MSYALPQLRLNPIRWLCISLLNEISILVGWISHNQHLIFSIDTWWGRVIGTQHNYQSGIGYVTRLTNAHQWIICQLDRIFLCNIHSCEKKKWIIDWFNECYKKAKKVRPICHFLIVQYRHWNHCKSVDFYDVVLVGSNHDTVFYTKAPTSYPDL